MEAGSASRLRVGLTPNLTPKRIRVSVFNLIGKEVLTWHAEGIARGTSGSVQMGAGRAGFFVVAELAANAAYGKDNVADALDMFSLAGVVTQTTLTTAGNQKAFRLDAGAELVALAGPAIPNPDWAARFRLLLALVGFVSTAQGNGAARAAAIHALLEAHQHDLARVGTFPHMRQGVEAVNEDFDRWSIGALRSWAALDHADGVQV
jgi:hypothetical protein